MNKPWLAEGSIWKTEALYWAWLRSQLRRVWSAYPIKSAYKRTLGRPPTIHERKLKVFHPSTKRVCPCNNCGRVMPISKLQVDHVVGNHSLLSFDDVKAFVIAMGALTFDDFQPLCKSCNSIKGTAETHGQTFEQALDRRCVIKYTKQLNVEKMLLLAGAKLTTKKQQAIDIQNLLVSKMTTLEKLDFIESGLIRNKK